MLGEVGMPSEKSPAGPAARDQDGFVPAVVARSIAQAGRYRDLLDDHDIPAIIATDEELERLGPGKPEMTHGVPVLVPEAMLDEASEVISEWEDFEDYRAKEQDDLDEEEDDDLACDADRLDSGFQGILGEEGEDLIDGAQDTDNDENDEDSGDSDDEKLL